MFSKNPDMVYGANRKWLEINEQIRDGKYDA